MHILWAVETKSRLQCSEAAKFRGSSSAVIIEMNFNCLLWSLEIFRLFTTYWWGNVALVATSTFLQTPCQPCLPKWQIHPLQLLREKILVTMTGLHLANRHLHPSMV